MVITIDEKVFIEYDNTDISTYSQLISLLNKKGETQ